MNITLQPPLKNPLNLEDTSLLYHYTDLNALLGIVRPNNIIMWATHYQYLNDINEVTMGVAAMKKYLESIKLEMFNNLFIISFSKAADNLAMWRMYSGNYSGCIIGLKHNKVGGNIVRCTYNEESASKCIIDAQNLLSKGAVSTFDEFGSMHINKDRSAGNDLKKYALDRITIATAIGIKNNEFAYEDEIRIYLTIGDKYVDVIKYRSRKNVIIPYVECEIAKDALAEIWIPNSGVADLTKNSIQRMLIQYGYDNVEIKISQSGYRSV